MGGGGGVCLSNGVTFLSTLPVGQKKQNILRFQNAVNNLNGKANTDPSDTKTCLSLENESSKAKIDRWSHQQIQVLTNMQIVNEYQKF